MHEHATNFVAAEGARATVGARLKAETAEHHRRAETHTFQKSLASGRLGRENYAAWLGQMLLIHRALETKLEESRRHSPAVRAVVGDEQFQVPYLLEDLRFFGVDPSGVKPLPATREFERQVGGLDARRDALVLLGMHYVLEGSNNGNRFIARAVGPGLGLRDGGMKYLVPYGERQPALWAEFKSTLDAQGLSDAEADTMVEAAKVMFDWISRLSEDLSRA